MKLQEILDAIQEKYPHSLSNDTVVSKINVIQRELFRTLYRPETSHQYDIIAGNPFYSISYSPEKIIGVLVNNTNYPLSNIRSETIAPCYYVMENRTLVLVPKPAFDSAGGLVVFHYAEPLTLSTGDMSREPDFDRDWHPIIVYRVCKEIAESMNDVGMMNGFISQVNSYEDEYKRSKLYQPIAIQNVFGGLI